MKYLIYTILLFFTFSFGSQDKLKEVLIGFQNEYQKVAFSMNFEMYYLNNNNLKEEYEKGTIQIGEKSYYTQVNSKLTFVDDEYELRINTKRNEIEISKSIKKSKKTGFDPDKFLENWNNNEAISLVETSLFYKILTKEVGYTQTFFLDKTNYQLKKVLYEFEEDKLTPTFQVNYSNIKTGLKNDAIISSHKHFIKSKQGSYTGINEFKNYKIKIK